MFSITNPNRDGSYIDSPDWIINKKTTIKQNCVIWIETVSLYTYIKTDDIYKDIAEDVKTRLGLGSKTYDYLIGDCSEDKKAKRIKKCDIK